MEKKIRALGIAPYDGMKYAMASLAEDYPQMELTLFVGDLERGLEVAQDNFHGNYDVVISRGGTAKMLQQHLPLPVIEIDMSLYDVLCALKLARNVSGRVVIVSLAEFGSGVRALGELLGCEVEVVIPGSREQVEEALLEVRRKEYAVLLCDMVANATAKKLGMNSYLIVSGTDSIRQAFDRAIQLCRSLERLKNENSFFRQIIDGQISDTVVFAAGGAVFLSTAQEAPPELMDLLRQEIAETVRERHRRFSRVLNGMIYSIRAQQINAGTLDYTAFFFTCRKSPLPANQTGISYLTRSDAEQSYFDSILCICGVIQDYQSRLAAISGSRSPVLITGEDGTGMETIAYVVYIRSELKNSSLVQIDCSQLNEKSWNFLAEHPGSPLADEGNTLYFSNIAILTQERQRQLLGMLLDMDVCRRNRVIFSCLCQPGEQQSEVGALFSDTLCCLLFPMTPLREDPGRIPALVNLALNHMNADLPQHILGVEPAAMDMLQHFSWPHNYLQFRRVIGNLAATSLLPIISAQLVSRALRTERHVGAFRLSAEGASAPLDLNRPLNQIERDIAFRVVEENGGNQSAAAKRLGISRTTLWRLLKEN